MRDIIVTLLVFGALPFILGRPAFGILVWNWIGYMNPHRLTWGFAYSFPFAQVVGLVTLFAVVFSKDKIRIPFNSTIVLWALFILWISATTLFAIDAENSVPLWEKAIKIQLFAWLTVGLMQTEKRVMALVWVTVGSLGFFGLKGGLWAARTGADNRVWGPPGSFIEDNNALALALIMTIPLMVFLAMRASDKWMKRGLFGLIAVTGLSVLSSHSRGAFLAAAVMLLLLWFKSRRKGVILLAALATIPLLVSFMPDHWFQRMETISTYQEDKSAMGRITAWKFGFQMASQRALGGGFGSFVEENYRRFSPEISAEIDIRDGRFQDAHSIYFKVLGEHGFVGLLLFLALGISAYRCGNWIRKHAGQIPAMLWARDLAAVLQASLIGFAVGGAFLGLAYFDLYFNLIAIIVVLKVMVQRQIAAEKDIAQPHGSPATAPLPQRMARANDVPMGSGTPKTAFLKPKPVGKRPRSQGQN
jgi:probable O-glycosylation ligase (exosortase A-associated)